MYMIEYIDGIHETVDYHSDFKVRVFSNDAYENYPQHWHSDVEIIIPIENKYRVKIAKKVYELNEGDILVIPPGEVHELYAPEKGKRVILQFDGTLLHNFKGFTSAFNMYHPCVHVKSKSMPKIHKQLSELALSITSEYFSSQPYREAAAYASLVNFFTILGRNYTVTNDKPAIVNGQKQHQYINQVFKVCRYIDRHCTESIEIDYLAKMAGFSKFHFHRIFKQVMNVTCHEYLNSCRIMEAEKLLAEPDLTIIQIGFGSGFSSQATFYRLFKKKNLCTPMEYKTLHCAN